MPSPAQLIIFYGLPTLLTIAALLVVTWKSPPSLLRWDLLLIALLFAVGVYRLEGLWPWQTWPVIRSFHWLPLGTLALGVFAVLSARFASIPLLIRLAILSLILTIVSFGIIKPYYLQLWPDETPEAHRRFLAVALVLLALHASGMGLLARRFSPLPVLIVMGIVQLAGIAFALEAASSLKIAQLLGITGVTIGAFFVVSIFRPSPLPPEAAFLISGLAGVCLLFSFYVTDPAPPASSVALWLLSPVIGFVWSVRKHDADRKGKLAFGIVCLWMISLLAVAAFFVWQQKERVKEEEGEDSYDYGELYGALPEETESPIRRNHSLTKISHTDGI